MNSPTPAIQIENLAYAYGRAEAVHDLSLKVQPGRCYGLFGRNGAGKTTTMKCLLNLLRPQRGQVRVCRWLGVRLALHVRVPSCRAGLVHLLSDSDLFLLLVRLRSKWHRKRSDVDHAFYCRDPICLRGRDMAWTRSGAVNGHAEGFRHFLLS